MMMRTGLPFFALGLMACGSISDEFGKPGPSSATPVPVGIGPTTAPTPADVRPVQTALRAPPAITGGTLLVTRDGTLAVAADPDRDRVSVVRLDTATVVATIPLTQGDEPGRLVEDGNRRVHVALRRGGALVTIDLATNTVTARRNVCGAPRGLAYDAARDQVHVACAGGELVSFPAAGGDAVRRLALDVDLRDVVVRPGGALFVSRFKSGDLLAVDTSGNVTGRTKLRAIERASDGSSINQFVPTVDPIEPAVAWRTLGVPDGTTLVLHQYGLAASIKLPPAQAKPDAGAAAQPVPPQPTDPGGGSPYGAPPGGCGGLVQPAISQVSADGTTVAMGAPIIVPVLTVDASLSADGSSLALAHAGVRDPQNPSSNPNEAFMSPPTSGVTILSRVGIAALDSMPAACLRTGSSLSVSGQVTAVAFNPATTPAAMESQTWLAVQTREPASLSLVRDPLGSTIRVVPLGGNSVLDTGHELFHRDAGGGIACASCHAEGGEDGRVWRFDPIGDRRTQAVHVGLKGTEPFHWDGDMTSFGMLVDEVMVRRMGGSPESDPRKAALQNWLYSLTPPAPVMAADAVAAVRGRALFESAEVGCTGCHSGPHLTTNQNAFVGTTDPGHVLQVPSLHGIAYRAPYLHNGCAVTLRDRFDPGCGGGDQHGHTSQLAEAQLSDLIAYLETL
jgi:hypothetical protein